MASIFRIADPVTERGGETTMPTTLELTFAILAVLMLALATMTAFGVIL